MTTFHLSTALVSSMLVSTATFGQGPMLAADTAIAAAPDQAQVFEFDFFAPFSPVTALDMVEQLPGFTLSEGDTERRGLGDSFGNLLIDGDRPTNKSVALTTLLARIPAGRVERIELLPAGQAQFDAQGHSLLVNVILRPDTGLSGAYSATWRQFDGGRSMPAGSLSATWPLESGSVSAGVSFSFWSPRVTRVRSLWAPDGVALSTSRESDQRFDRAIAPTASVNLDFENGASLRLDGEAQVWSLHRNFFRTSTAAADGQNSFSAFQSEDHGTGYRLSGTFERPFGDSIGLRTVALASRDETHEGPTRFERFTETGFAGASIVSFQDNLQELAVRQEMTWNRSARHSFELGAEAAFNTGDSRLVTQLDNGQSAVPIALPVAATQIEESRTELFMRHLWTLSDRINMTSGLRWESSDLELSGDVAETRSFSFLKPSITLDVDISGSSRIRLQAVRDVDQLDFGKFASSVNEADNISVVGNPDYTPQRSWSLTAEYERRWANDALLRLAVAHSWMEDLDDWIPVITANGIYDAPGNIGDGTRLRVALDISSPLAPVGLHNAQLDLSYVYQDTQVTDPLTGEERVWSAVPVHRLTANFRQAFPAHSMAWGWTYRGRSDIHVFRATEQQLNDAKNGDLDAYLETTRWRGILMRFGVLTALNTGGDRTRVFHDPGRGTGAVTGREESHATRGRIAYIRLSGSF
ncbi:TonB-dependent receptor plug domain-containing protein [Maricaulis parjimensis]|uniref:TonB-dependent receptor plug domain-containing protein n=1 Tax=Maricaulis parjimensis TaxID=144023 RepID=UPI00193AA904|nr:TonB-dependent receptor [Maricaulis parjimensis]